MSFNGNEEDLPPEGGYGGYAQLSDVLITDVDVSCIQKTLLSGIYQKTLCSIRLSKIPSAYHSPTLWKKRQSWSCSLFKSFDDIKYLFENTEQIKRKTI